MNRPELYKITVDILVQSYFNDTLEHFNCYACAVGNIVAANLGLKIVEIPYRPGKCWGENAPSPEWVYVIRLRQRGRFSQINNYEYSEEAKRQIKATGYSLYEISQIEIAFESVVRGYDDTEDEYIFKGLSAVIDFLDKIHENKDVNITSEVKKKFVKV